MPIMPEYVIGLDPSLVGNALAILHGVNGHIHKVRGWTDKKTVAARHEELSFFKMKQNTQIDKLLRIRHMADWVIDTISSFGSCAVALEGYAFSRASTSASDLHELCGLIKQYLVSRGTPFRIYQPTTIKIAWTGSGNADKAQMQMACFHDSGQDYTQMTGAGDGLADAYLIAKLLWWDLQIKTGKKGLKDAPVTIRQVLQRKTKAEPIPLLQRELLCSGGKRG